MVSIGVGLGIAVGRGGAVATPPSFVAINSVSNGSGATAVTIPMPAGAQSGDLLIASIGYGGSGTITPPAGWTLIRNTNASSRRLATFRRTADGSEGASQEWTLGASVVNIGAIAAYRSAAASPEVEDGATANSTSLTAPSITTLGEKRMLVWAGVANAQNITKPTEMTSRFAQNNGSIGLCVADELRDANGAVGTRVGTIGGAALNAAHIAAFAPR